MVLIRYIFFISSQTNQIEDNSGLHHHSWDTPGLHQRTFYSTILCNILFTIILVSFNMNLANLYGNTHLNCKFTMKYEYNSRFNKKDCRESCCTFIRKHNCPPKLKCFLWLVCQGEILINKKWVNRNLVTYMNCPNCASSNEFILFIFSVIIIL